MKVRKTGYKPLSVLFENEDTDQLEQFFESHPRIKRGIFYRDAIIEKIEREELLDREREAIRAGRTQVDPILLERAQ